jgi:predicted phage terminase large subunit-like protein
MPRTAQTDQARAEKQAQAEALQQAAELKKQLLAAKRLLTLKRARESLIDFTTMSMPDPEDPDNTDLSRYSPQLHHRAIANALERVERGEILRLVITLGPRHGKSELVSKRLPAWFVGRDPYRHVIVSGYSDTFTEEFGKEVRETMISPFYRQVFPACALRKGSKAANRLQTTAGGVMTFTGVGGGLTGRGADLLIIDDPIKNDEEAQSLTTREKQWDWFRRVAMTRVMRTSGRVVICMTRWHEDDLVGRLTDPTNEHFNHDIAKDWHILHIPTIAEENDPLRRPVGAPLWPEMASLEFLQQMRLLDPRGFSALYQGRPTPEEGNEIKREQLERCLYHDPAAMPRNLRPYAASDHAVSEEQRRDPTCMGIVGIDDNGILWVHPDLFWRQADTEVVVEAMLAMMRDHEPQIWWAEKGHISKSIGPFLRKRMVDEHTFINLQEVTPAKDKLTRARAIIAMIAMGRVRFPAFAPWWGRAMDEMLKFPNGKHDDFVDMLAYIGLGLRQQVAAAVPAPERPSIRGPSGNRMPIEWIKYSSKLRARERAMTNSGF